MRLSSRVSYTFPRVYRSGADPRSLMPLALDASSTLTSQHNPAVSRAGDFIAYENGFKPDGVTPATYSLRVSRLGTLEQTAEVPGGKHPAWSPVADTVALVRGSDLIECAAGGTCAVRLGAGAEIQWPAYSPDGSDIAFQIKSGGRWRVRLASGASAPASAGFDDTRPA